MTAHQFLVILLTILPIIRSFPEDVYRSNYRFVEKGDINIGAILSVHGTSLPRKCSEEIRDTKNIQNVEALHFAINEINNRTDILPVLKLGFVALDDCQSPEMALARAVQFMPRRVSGYPVWVENDTANNELFYDVAGVIGPYTSKLSIIVANVLNLWQLPQISQTATSDVLSDKTRFPYFFRMVPPDRYQVKVIARLLQHFNWTHISVVYSEGSYGWEGLKVLREILKDAIPFVCIEDTIEIVYQSGGAEFLQVLQQLNNNKEVKVVVAYVELEDAMSLSDAVIAAKLQNRFVWLGSDSMGITLGNQPERCRSFPSSLSIEPQKGEIRNFRAYLARLSTKQAQSDNPWLNVLLQQSTKTSVDTHLSLEWRLADHDENYLKKSFAESYIIDSVYAFAHAIDNVVRKNCSGRKKKLALVTCIMEVGIFDELKSLQFNGSFGTVKFNDNGDVISKYDIKQCISIGSHTGTIKVGYWDMNNEQLFLNDVELFWPGKEVPHSACSEPCWKSPGKIFHYQQRTCCWECLSCKPNEIVTTNVTKCESCPNFYWPDSSRISCERIVPFYMSFAEPVAIGLGVASVTGILLCMVTGIALLKYRNEHVIKCTSVELSFMILVGAFLAYCLPISFLSKPNKYKCYINHIGFSLTFTAVYAPLLVKTNRIFRIFKSGRRTTRKPFCISKASQILISFTLIIFQVAIVIISTSLRPPEVREEMPVKLERFVEQFCDLPMESLLSSLCFNLILVLICTIYAFKTRKLPDNYKESRYISYCVDTTVLIWITFLPTYFTTSRADAKVTIMAVSLLLNASVTVTCLFIPRFLSLYKTRTNMQSPSSHHYKDFRIVKHVVTRKRSMEFQIKDRNADIQTHRVSSAVTITSDITSQDVSDVLLGVSKNDYERDVK